MHRSLFLILAILSTAAVAAAQAQPKPSPTPKTDDQEPVKVFTEEIRLPVGAKDTYGHYDPTLSIDDLLVLEDGQPQTIRSIQHLPTNVLVLLDLGNQLGLKDTYLTRQAALTVVSQLFAGNKVAVMQFASQPELLQSWTTDREAVEKILKTKLKSGKSSRLSDALSAAADQFKDIPPGTRHIVIITDGVDAPGGKLPLSGAVKKLNAIQASVHIISYTVLERAALQTQTKIQSGGDGVQRDGHPGSNPVANGDPTLPPTATRTPSFKIGSIDLDRAMRRKRKEYERATIESEKQLTQIAEESGGQIIIPSTTADVTTQAAIIARDIGSQYVVTYRPTRPLADAKAGEYRKVEVVSRRVGLYLRSRQGYVVP